MDETNQAMARKANSKGSNVTLKEVARALGVSTMTISRAINNRPNVDESTRKRIIDKAREMGYMPNHVAKSLVSSKTYTIGVTIPEISHAFFPEVVRGIEEATYKMNYQLFLANTAESFEREIKAIDSLRSKRVDGIMVSSSQTEDDYTYYQQVINSGLPFVFFDRCIEDIGASCVGVNDESGSRQRGTNSYQRLRGDRSGIQNQQISYYAVFTYRLHCILCLLFYYSWPGTFYCKKKTNRRFRRLFPGQ